MSTFRHLVLVRFKEDATEQQIDDLLQGLARLPGQIDVIRRYQFGLDLGVIEGNPDLALVADFDSEDDWHTYLDHPAHKDLSHNLTAPIAAELIRSQYLVD